jgi:hypothetical protein
MSGVRAQLPALVIAFGGIGAAVLWFFVWEPLAFVPPLIAAAVGLAADYQAKRAIDRDDPVRASKWINGWILVPLALGIAAAGAVIVIAVLLDPGDNPSVERKEVFSAASAALGAFLVAMFVKDAEQADEAWVGDRFRRKVQKRFRDRFPREPGKPATRGELAVLDDAALGFAGWGRDARERRAQIIAEELPKQPKAGD